MSYFLELASTGLAAVLLHPLRSAATVTVLVAVLTPYLAGLGLSEGIREEAEASVSEGADLYVSATEFGRSVPIPVGVADEIRRLKGVSDVVPRIVGQLALGKDAEPAVVVGLPPDRFPPGLDCVEGRLPQSAPRIELVVGRQLAHRLHLNVGAVLLPFPTSGQAARIPEVVGLFRADVSLWEANLVLMPFDKAQAVFNQPGMATDLLVYCPDRGYLARLTERILTGIPLPSPGNGRHLSPRVVLKDELNAIIPRGLLHREGVFNLHFVLLFVVGILVVLVTSGIGLSEARREIAILKATGWQTDEVMLRGGVESLVLSLAGAAAAVVLAFVWLRWLNGYFIASIFLAGVDVAPVFRVPFALTPVPALLAFLISFAVVMTGTLYSIWRAATAPPMAAMR
jgi:ABC-type lipoprotein release transport system permease subunit